MRLIFSFLILFLFPICFYAQEKSFEPVKKEADYSGYWKLESFTEGSYGVQLLKDEDCPGGYYLSLKAGTGYLSSYIDEYGAAIDFGFSYEMKNGKFKAVYDAGNALGHLMNHEGTKFSFKLFYSPEEKVLKLINNKKEAFIFIPY